MLLIRIFVEKDFSQLVWFYHFLNYTYCRINPKCLCLIVIYRGLQNWVMLIQNLSHYGNIRAKHWPRILTLWPLTSPNQCQLPMQWNVARCHSSGMYHSKGGIILCRKGVPPNYRKFASLKLQPPISASKKLWIPTTHTLCPLNRLKLKIVLNLFFF